jgi:Xaa-Pro aminopeptidase
VTDVLLYGDTFRSPELRHEVPVGIPDPFLYVEHDGVRHVVIGSMEIPRVEVLGRFEIHPTEEYGVDELVAQGLPYREITGEVIRRAVEALGVTSATVPDSFPIRFADLLRSSGVELQIDQELFDDRRRVKNEAELAGVRRAQRAAEAGMEAARSLLARATQNGAGLELDGEPLTSERIKVAISQAFVANGATGDEFIVSHGPQAAIGHHMGEGQIQAGEPVVIDLWPRDNESACFADMTRTFVVGDIPAELVEWHRLVKESLDQSLAAVREGASCRGLYDISCEGFEAAGQLTGRTKEPGKPLEEGYFHSLGHGVGLEVHEEPGMGRAAQSTLRAGDVITIEPGLYRPGFGGLRLEDLILVTEDGAENLTRFPYDLTP